MTLKDKFERDGTALDGVQGELSTDCLNETVIEIGRDRQFVLSQIECGDYILDVLGSGDTILILESDIDEPYHADIKHLLPERD